MQTVTIACSIFTSENTGRDQPEFIQRVEFYTEPILMCDWYSLSLSCPDRLLEDGAIVSLRHGGHERALTLLLLHSLASTGDISATIYATRHQYGCPRAVICTYACTWTVLAVLVRTQSQQYTLAKQDRILFDETYIRFIYLLSISAAI